MLLTYSFQGGSAMQYVCPDGLHFNPATKYFEYPCAYPSEVKCMAGDQERTYLEILSQNLSLNTGSSL